MQFTISRKPAIVSPYILVRLGTNEIETGHNCVECRAERPLKNGLRQAQHLDRPGLCRSIRLSSFQEVDHSHQNGRQNDPEQLEPVVKRDANELW